MDRDPVVAQLPMVLVLVKVSILISIKVIWVVAALAAVVPAAVAAVVLAKVPMHLLQLAVEKMWGKRLFKRSLIR